MSSNESGVPVTSTPANAGGDRRVYCDDCMGGVFSPDGVHIDPTTELNRLLDRERAALAAVRELREAVRVLVTIANAYDDNALDDEARKTWGINDEYENTDDPKTIELYSGRGGRRLLTLADCLNARTALANTKDIAP